MNNFRVVIVHASKKCPHRGKQMIQNVQQQQKTSVLKETNERKAKQSKNEDD